MRTQLARLTPDSGTATIRWSVCIAATLASLFVGALPAAAQTELVEYYATDALGSIRVVFHPNGTVRARTDYLPFGEEWQPSGNLPPERFTGQERDAEVGLDYFNARSYQVRTGRMNRVDPVGGSPANPQSWNRYSYVMNNPLGATDPTGRQADSLFRDESCRAEFSFDQCGGSDAFWGTVASLFGFGNERAEAVNMGWFPGMPAEVWVGLDAFHKASQRAFDEARQKITEKAFAILTSEEFAITLDVLAIAGALAEPSPGGELLLAARGAARGGAAAVRLGQAGEAAVRAAHDIGPATKIFVNGVERIPDGLNLTTKVLSEVKNVESLSYTQQLRDFAQYAGQNGLRFDLYVRPGAELSGPLQQAVARGDIKLLFIP